MTTRFPGYRKNMINLRYPKKCASITKSPRVLECSIAKTICLWSFSIIGELQTPPSSFFRWFLVLEAIKIWCILKTFRSFQLKTINFQWEISTFQWEISVTFRNRGSNTKNHLKIELGGGKYFPMVENLRMLACDPRYAPRSQPTAQINTKVVGIDVTPR